MKEEEEDDDDDDDEEEEEEEGEEDDDEEEEEEELVCFAFCDPLWVVPACRTWKRGRRKPRFRPSNFN